MAMVTAYLDAWKRHRIDESTPDYDDDHQSSPQGLTASSHDPPAYNLLSKPPLPPNHPRSADGLQQYEWNKDDKNNDINLGYSNRKSQSPAPPIRDNITPIRLQCRTAWDSKAEIEMRLLKEFEELEKYCGCGIGGGRGGFGTDSREAGKDMESTGNISADEDDDGDEFGEDLDDDDGEENCNQEENVGQRATCFDVDSDPDAADDELLPKRSATVRTSTTALAKEMKLPPWRRRRPKQQMQQKLIEEGEEEGTWEADDVNLDEDRTPKEHWGITRSPPPTRVALPIGHNDKDWVVGFGGASSTDNEDGRLMDNGWRVKDASAGSNMRQAQLGICQVQDREPHDKAEEEDTEGAGMYSDPRDHRITANHAGINQSHYSEHDEEEPNISRNDDNGDEDAHLPLFPGLRKQKNRWTEDGAQDEGHDQSSILTDDVDPDEASEGKERQNETGTDNSDKLAALRRKVKELEGELAVFKKKEDENAKFATNILKEK
ncbi:hypothetical protein HK102_011620, partial [Quaeritorhiza haematococci]